MFGYNTKKVRKVGVVDVGIGVGGWGGVDGWVWDIRGREWKSIVDINIAIILLKISIGLHELTSFC